MVSFTALVAGRTWHNFSILRGWSASWTESPSQSSYAGHLPICLELIIPDNGRLICSLDHISAGLGWCFTCSMRPQGEGGQGCSYGQSWQYRPFWTPEVTRVLGSWESCYRLAVFFLLDTSYEILPWIAFEYRRSVEDFTMKSMCIRMLRASRPIEYDRWELSEGCYQRDWPWHMNSQACRWGIEFGEAEFVNMDELLGNRRLAVNDRFVQMDGLIGNDGVDRSRPVFWERWVR